MTTAALPTMTATAPPAMPGILRTADTTAAEIPPRPAAIPATRGRRTERVKKHFPFFLPRPRFCPPWPVFFWRNSNRTGTQIPGPESRKKNFLPDPGFSLPLPYSTHRTQPQGPRPPTKKSEEMNGMKKTVQREGVLPGLHGRPLPSPCSPVRDHRHRRDRSRRLLRREPDCRHPAAEREPGDRSHLWTTRATSPPSPP